MKNFLDNAWRQIREFFKNLDKRRRIIAAVLAACVITLAVVLSIALNRTNYELLYVGLSQEEAGTIYATLQDMGVDVRVRGTGTLMVPAERVSELRMTLSAAGYEAGGFDYSILAEASGFSVSDLEQQEYAVYQKQEMLRTAIRKSEKVDDCLVLISPAVESPFMRPDEEKEASAAIMLTIKNGETLSAGDARAIGSIAVNAVSGLRFENVSVVDAALNVYLITDDPQAENETTNLTTQKLLETSMRHELESQIINLLTPVFGAGKVKAMVSLTLDFDDEKTEVIEFAPPVEGEDEGLVISMSELYENARADGVAGGVPGTDNNGMGTEEDIDGTIEYPYGELDEDETYRKILREMNLEINKSTTQIEKAKGAIKTLTIGVLLDTLTVPEDYTENVRNLVAGALGTSVGYVNVERMPFQEMEANPILLGVNAQVDAMNKYKMQELIQTGIICATALIFAILILALIRSLFKKPAPVPLAEEAEEGGIDYIVGDDEDISGMYGGEDMPPVGQQQEEEEEDVTVGAPPPETVVQLEKMIKSNPEAVASILRNWLAEEQ
ncbi:MAG: flagellar M-ring protein FliF [Oscillospiraceae bacterium]|nr:flagellar M-ring protein FliF [Oscillospiraceae bacterium]